MGYGPISDNGGQLDLIFDAAPLLEEGEVLQASPASTVTAENTSVLSISQIAVNTTAQTVDGKTVEAEKGVGWRVTTGTGSYDPGDYWMVIRIAGDGGTILDIRRKISVKSNL